MALFSREKEKKSEEKNETVVAPKKSEVSKALPTDRDLASVLLKPRITEKGMGMGEKNVYTFMVRRDATKYDVKDAIKELFKVTPVKVNIVNKSPRQFMSRSKGRRLTEKGMKKAYVYLKQGDRIDLV